MVKSCQHLVTSSSVLILLRSGGDGIRTHCLYIANVALYQLSYTPEGVPTLAESVTTGLTAPLVVEYRLVEGFFLVIRLVIVNRRFDVLISNLVGRRPANGDQRRGFEVPDRKSTRLNSS